MCASALAGWSSSVRQPSWNGECQRISLQESLLQLHAQPGKERRRASDQRTVSVLDGKARKPAFQLPGEGHARAAAACGLRLHRRHDRQLHLRAVREVPRLIQKVRIATDSHGSRKKKYPVKMHGERFSYLVATLVTTSYNTRNPRRTSSTRMRSSFPCSVLPSSSVGVYGVNPYELIPRGR